ncbi:hypothetical protein [Erythrobacter aureus]|uniref:hypothetical protein n=1 Tax=Erythrobacter aureus TaxID=2182384 RepID=UPI003A952040
MRKTLLPAAALSLAPAAPAQATGGYICRTADGSDLEIAVRIGHVPGAPIIGTQLRAKDRAIPVNAPQWWLDGEELRLLLTDANALETLVTLHARYNGGRYDGTVEWQGAKRWIRCYEN